MKQFVRIAFLAFITLVFDACYSYRTIQNVNDVTPDSELRVTTSDGRTLSLRSWYIDTSGTLRGMQQMDRREERPVRISLRELRTIEQREFDTTTTIVVSIAVGIPAALFIYALVSWH